MTKSILTAVFLAFALPVFADQSVYSDKLDNGWQDWSWAKVTKSGKTITVTAKKAWEGLAFHHAPQKSSEFSAVTFKVSGGATGGQRLQLRALVGKTPLKEAFLPALAPGKWTTVTIPMKNLGLTGQAFEGFWVQAQKPCTFQVQGVAFKK